MDDRTYLITITMPYRRLWSDKLVRAGFRSVEGREALAELRRLEGFIDRLLPPGVDSEASTHS